MDKTLIFGHFHMEVNLEMIPNLSRRAAKSLKIEIFNFKILKNIYLFLKIEKINILKKKLSIFRHAAPRRDSPDPQISTARQDRLVYFFTFFCP
jgi:hypothetical protein